MSANGQSSKPRYQLLPELREEEYAALEADIRKRGVLIPVEKDDEGNILDGHNRAEIAGRLEIPCPEVVRHFDTEQEKREHVIKLNLARRHLDALRWGQAFKLLLEERGVHTNRGPKPKESISATVAEIAAELGVPERTARHRLHKANEYESLPESLQAKVDEGEATVSQAVAEARRQEKREELSRKAEEVERRDAAETATTAELLLQKWSVVHGDSVEELSRLSPGLARLVFADPPYNVGIDYGEGKKADLWPDDVYMAWAERWIAGCKEALSADGSLWVLIGDEYAAEYAVALKRARFTIRGWIKWYETFGVNCANRFNRCSRHLFYCVKDAYRFVFNPDAVTRPSARQVVYNDGRAADGGKLWDDVWIIPRLVGTAKERIPDFPTQLPLDLLRPIIGCASEPGDLILDPFSGSATTGAAALELGRRYVGIERSERFASLSTLRLKGIRS